MNTDWMLLGLVLLLITAVPLSWSLWQLLRRKTDGVNTTSVGSDEATFRLDRPAGGCSGTTDLAASGSTSDGEDSGDSVSDQSQDDTDSWEKLDEDSAGGSDAAAVAAGDGDSGSARIVSNLERYQRLREGKSNFWFSCNSRNQGSLAFCPTSVAGKPDLVRQYLETNEAIAQIIADCINQADSETLNVIVNDVCSFGLAYLLYRSFKLLKSRSTEFPHKGFALTLLKDQSSEEVERIQSGAKSLMDVVATRCLLQALVAGQERPYQYFDRLRLTANSRSKLPPLSYPVFVANLIARDPSVEVSMDLFCGSLGMEIAATKSAMDQASVN